MWGFFIEINARDVQDEFGSVVSVCNGFLKSMAYTKAFQARGSKYKAVKQKFEGKTYDSKKEAQYAQQIEWRKKVGEIKEIIPQFKIELYVNGSKICNYYVDFKLIMPDGSIEFHEVKGFETDVWKLKWKLTEALLEEIEPNGKLVLIK